MMSGKLFVSTCIIIVLGGSTAFQRRHFHRQLSRRRIQPTLHSSASDAEEFVASKFPSCSALLIKNKDVMKAINDSDAGYTVFAPNDDAFKALGDKKLMQLKDDRNGEMAEKIAAYHVIAEPVTADELFDAGGVITMGGEVPIERTVSGGLFGVGGKEDGGIALNSAKVLNSFEFSGDTGKMCIVHEVNAFISPNILWRYADQLRIPGSK
ncbi:hypothetical protein ACHAXS_001636 [Conticribra weissflogii]